VEPDRLYLGSSSHCRLHVRATSSGGSCSRSASTWEPWMTATSLPRHEGSNWMAGFGPFLGKPLTTRPAGLTLHHFHHLLIHELMQREQKQSYEIMRSVFERYRDLQTAEIGPEVSFLVQQYITEVERNQPSYDDLQSRQLNGSWMSPIWLYEGYVDSFHFPRSVACYPFAGIGPTKGQTFACAAPCRIYQHSHPPKPPVEYYELKDN